jgi:hypothetical protein
MAGTDPLRDMLERLSFASLAKESKPTPEIEVRALFDRSRILRLTHWDREGTAPDKLLPLRRRYWRLDTLSDEGIAPVSLHLVSWM